jgi:hypothetical protein
MRNGLCRPSVNFTFPPLFQIHITNSIEKHSFLKYTETTNKIAFKTSK